MYYFTFEPTKLHKICNSYTHITIFHTPLDDFLSKKLHSCLHFSTFFTLLRVKIIEIATTTPNAHG